MDPEANLREQRRLAKAIMKKIDSGQTEDLVDDANRLADLVVALDEWISRGGVLPPSWKHHTYYTEVMGMQRPAKKRNDDQG